MKQKNTLRLPGGYVIFPAAALAPRPQDDAWIAFFRKVRKLNEQHPHATIVLVGRTGKSAPGHSTPAASARQ